MSEYISRSAAWSWLTKRALSPVDGEARPPVTPSLASVEYELSQLRLSLRDLVDFDDPSARRRPVAQKAATAAVPGLARHYDLQHKIAARRY